MDQRLDQDVVDVLSRASAFGKALRLPPEQLDRKLYERVNKALTNAGGKWNTQAKAHIFSTEAQPKLQVMLGSGISVDEKKRDQSFFTAGRGAIADACVELGAASIDVFETNPEYTQELYRKGYNYIADDFLAYACRKDFPYERIVMNPPFTKNQDMKHVKHALTYLAPNGILVSLMMPSQQRKGFQELVAEYDPEIIEVERGAFKESGTDIATIIVKIQRNNTVASTGTTTTSG